jgi:hypothetical protein
MTAQLFPDNDCAMAAISIGAGEQPDGMPRGGEPDGLQEQFAFTPSTKLSSTDRSHHAALPTA